MFSLYVTACVVKLIGRGQCIVESGLTEVMVFIWICKSEKGGGGIWIDGFSKNILILLTRGL